MDDLSELRILRKKIGLTQSELAKQASVSQSLIAKIESKKIDPSYTNAKKIFETLQKKGIGVQVHYIPVHLLSFYKKHFGYKKGDFPKTEKYYEQALTIPFFSKMAERDVRIVISSVRGVIRQFQK